MFLSMNHRLHKNYLTQKMLSSLPHISSATKESRIAMGESFKNIDYYLRGKKPPDLIKIKETDN